MSIDCGFAAAILFGESIIIPTRYQIMYQCITCQNELNNTSVDSFICSNCRNNYPILEGIALFIPEATTSLQGYITEMEEAKAGLTEMVGTLNNLQKQFGASEFSSRIKNTLKAVQTNLNVLQEPYLPIIEFLQKQPTNDNFLAWSIVKTGTTFLDMLPYFYQDWSGTSDFEKVKNRVCKTITENTVNRESVAVLGAGACGLLHSVADFFEISYGVDLSLPTLLAAKSFIRGKPLTFNLSDADWEKITLTPPKQSTKNIHYLATNVNNMPFKNGSLTLVITQYMLDIVSNPIGLAQEIRRVLKPEGLWINFSKPFRVAGDPSILGMRKMDELPPLFNSLGFEVINLENERFNYLNLEKVSNEVDTVNQLVNFFTLRKRKSYERNDILKEVNRFFDPNCNNVWNETPRIVVDRKLIFSQQKSFDGTSSVNESLSISVMGHTFSIPPDFAFLLETIFSAIDGERNLRAIYLIQKDVIGLDENSFLLLIYILNVLHYLIELD
ncbi:MAG: methyltransferase domain-containing protein [Methylococcaceae bacterium]|nr:methyltransferase domain-containing protein [Methylococcaceae bacterium]